MITRGNELVLKFKILFYFAVAQTSKTSPKPEKKVRYSWFSYNSPPRINSGWPLNCIIRKEYFMSEQEYTVGQGLGGRLRNMLFPVAALEEKKFISKFTFLFLQKKDT